MKKKKGKKNWIKTPRRNERERKREALKGAKRANTGGDLRKAKESKKRRMRIK